MADERLRAHSADNDDDSPGMLKSIFNVGSELFSSMTDYLSNSFSAPPSHTNGKQRSSPKRSSKSKPRYINVDQSMDSPSFATQVPLPPSPSDPSLPFQNIGSFNGTQVSASSRRSNGLHESSIDSFSQSYSGQNSPTSSRSPRRASSTVQVNGVSKPYRAHRKHIRHEQHRIKARQHLHQELIQIGRERGQPAQEVEGFIHYTELINRLHANEVFSASKRLPTGNKSSSSQQSASGLDGTKEDLWFNFNTHSLENAIRRARDTLDSSRVPHNFSQFLAELGDITQSSAKKSLPTSLSPEDQAEVTTSLQKRGTVAKVAREQIVDKDLARLKPAQWLNDEIINFYGALIMARSEELRKAKGKALDVHYFSTFFFAKLEDPGYEKARIGKWTKKFDIFKKNVVLIPVNLGNAHWTCAAINFDKKRIEYHDSMGRKRGKVYKYLRDYLNKEHRDKKKTDFDFTGWDDYFDDNAPQQENGYDCGVFSCQYMESISRGADFNFDQSNMTYLRQRMILEIVRGKLWDQQ